MDISSSQYNSASESGWTHYLDQSSLSGSYFQSRGGIVDYEGKGVTMEEEEEDLSMISDASSGPPHYHEDDDQHYCVNWYPSTTHNTKESEKKKKVKEYGDNQHPSPLDDTASSPVLNWNGAVENVPDFSPCFSATKIKRKSKFKKHFSFFERSLGGKQASEEPGDPLFCTLCFYVVFCLYKLTGVSFVASFIHFSPD
uniref:Uncharacterized protein n=1 Tax=Cajanus cajan TaxID=3821 RepID=A0A151TTI6_CAJCA|nr:hypothetical protein KK1_009608 [Cajanus cajan]